MPETVRDIRQTSIFLDAEEIAEAYSGAIISENGLEIRIRPYRGPLPYIVPYSIWQVDIAPIGNESVWVRVDVRDSESISLHPEIQRGQEREIPSGRSERFLWLLGKGRAELQISLPSGNVSAVVLDPEIVVDESNVMQELRRHFYLNYVLFCWARAVALPLKADERRHVIDAANNITAYYEGTASHPGIAREFAAELDPIINESMANYTALYGKDSNSAYAQEILARAEAVRRRTSIHDPN